MDYPVYKFFFKDDKLVYLIITTYGLEDSSAAHFRHFTWKGKALFGSANHITKQAKQYHFEPLSTYDGQYHNFKKGLTLIVEKERVRTVCLFLPLSEQQEKEIVTHLNSTAKISK